MRFELFKRIVLLGSVSTLLLSAMLGAYFVNLVAANPVPYPAIRMPYEYIDTTISLDEGVMKAKVNGTYTFEKFGYDNVTMNYPVPPDSEEISVKFGNTSLDWDYTGSNYSTVIGDFPMIRWFIKPLPKFELFNVTTYYEHPVPLLDGNYTFLYAMGTGRLLANWYKETTAYVTIRISMDVASPDTLNLYTIENSSGTWIWKPANYTITPENETWVITCAFQSESFQPLVEDLLLTFMPVLECTRTVQTIGGSETFFPCIYGNIITYVNDVWPHPIMYYNISTGELTDTGYYDPYLHFHYFHSLYENVITFPSKMKSLALYDISTGSITYLAYPYEFNVYDLTKWALIWPCRVISMYGDIIALIDAEGVWAYNITTESIVANLATGPSPGICVYENIIAFSDSFIWYHDLSTNITTNTLVPGVYPSVYGDIIAFQAGLTIKYYNISSGQVTTVGAGEAPSIHGNIIVFSTDESLVGKDLNGDGDMEDMVIRYYDVPTHTVTNTGEIGEYPSVYGSTIVFGTYESMVDIDLNLDGDKEDYVIRYTILLTDIAVINVTTSATVVEQSYPVSVNVTVKNQGRITETFNVTAYYDDIPIETKTVTNLPFGEETTLTFTWNTTGVEKGDHTISAKASVVQGETDTTDNTKVDGAVTVIIPGHDVAIKDVTPSSPKHNLTVVTEAYSTWVIDINVVVQNLGSFVESFTVQSFYGNATGNYTLGISPAFYSVTLAPGASTTKTFTWDVPTSAKVYPYWTYIIYADVSVLAGETDIADNFMVDGSVRVRWLGDATGEGQVNIYDLTKLALSWKKPKTHPAYNPLCDFTGDGKVDIYDLTKLAKNWKIGPIPG